MSAQLPIPAVEPLCPDCGQVRAEHGGALASHVSGAHHRALVLCTERASHGWAPVPAQIAAALESLGVPVETAGEMVATGRVVGVRREYRRARHEPLRWAQVDALESALGEMSYRGAGAAQIVAAARVVASTSAPWWRAWVQAITPPHLATHALDRARTSATQSLRGYPWPGIAAGRAAHAAQGEMQW